MHIIIDASVTQSKRHSGIGEYSKNLVEQLITQYSNQDFTLLLFDGEEVIRNSLLDQGNVDIVRIGSEKRGLSSLFTYHTQIRPAVGKILREGEIEQPIFFSPYYRHGLPVDMLPCVLTVHDFAMPHFNYYSDRGGLINWIRKQEYWYHMNQSFRADAIIANSDYTKGDFLRYFPSHDYGNVFVTPLGVQLDEVESDIDSYLPSDWKKRGYILYMGGGIQANKNSIGVVQAYNEFLRLVEERDGVHRDSAPYLVIAGKIFTKLDRPENVRLHRQIEKLDIQDHIHFSGFYDDESKYSLLKNAVTFIHLSLFEGFGIAVAEAMLAGVPVVAHNGTSYPEVVGDGGLLVDGREASEGGEALYKLYTDKQFASELGLKGKVEVQKFTWERCATESMKVFNFVADKRYD